MLGYRAGCNTKENTETDMQAMRQKARGPGIMMNEEEY